MMTNQIKSKYHEVMIAVPHASNNNSGNPQDVVYMDELGNECTILAAKTAKTLAQVGGSTHKSITFSFDRCYGSKFTTSEIYNEIPYSLVQVFTTYCMCCTHKPHFRTHPT